MATPLEEIRRREEIERRKEQRAARLKKNIPASELPIYCLGPLSRVRMQIRPPEKSSDSTQEYPLGLRVWDFIGAIKDFLRPHILFGREAWVAYQNQLAEEKAQRTLYLQLQRLKDKRLENMKSMDPQNWSQRCLRYDVNERGQISNLRYVAADEVADSEDRTRYCFGRTKTREFRDMLLKKVF